jgi:hypothetical protein
MSIAPCRGADEARGPVLVVRQGAHEVRVVGGVERRARQVALTAPSLAEYAGRAAERVDDETRIVREDDTSRKKRGEVTGLRQRIVLEGLERLDAPFGNRVFDNAAVSQIHDVNSGPRKEGPELTELSLVT